jgi:hypothetical protein
VTVLAIKSYETEKVETDKNKAKAKYKFKTVMKDLKLQNTSRYLKSPKAQKS